LTFGNLAALQRLVGNRTVCKMLAGAQAKPARSERRQVVQRRVVVGRADDPSESEADRIADDVLRRLRQGRAEPTEPLSPTVPTRIVRSNAPATPQVGAEGGEVGEELTGRIRSAAGGARLPGWTMQRMEAGFGTSFEDVRVHRDSPLPAQLSAEAFTLGNDIHVAPGRFAPSSPSGEHLLAHELAHVVQQSGAVVRRKLNIDGLNWSEASRINISGGPGLTGVFFLSDPGGETLVVKGVKGRARSQLAAEMMGAATGEHANSKTIALDSVQGKYLLKHMHRLASKYRRKHNTAKGQNPVKGKIERQLESGVFDAVMVMPMYENVTNLEDVHQRDDFPEVLQAMLDGGFFTDLGRIHAADMFMGNEDRLERMNDKNIFVQLTTGRSLGLDLDLRAANFDQVTKDVRTNPDAKPSSSDAPSIKGQELHDYVEFAIHGTSAKRKFKQGKKTIEGSAGMRGLGMATADVAHAADPAKAAKKFDELVARLRIRAVQAKLGNEAEIDKVDWAPSKKAFLAGVTEGLQTLTAKIDTVEARAGKLTAGIGDDAALDPLVFRIRTLYAQLIRKGSSEKDATQTCTDFARHVRAGGKPNEFIEKLDGKGA
jgi:hypothetical protein